MSIWSGVKVTTPPSSLPVTVAEAKAWLRVDHSEEDSLVETILRAAIARVDGPHGIGWGMMQQTWTVSLDTFPDAILLPGAPIKSVSSVTYVDSAGTTQTMDEDSYRVYIGGDQPTITPAYGLSWPPTRDVSGAVAIAYVVGESSAASVPADLKTAIMLLVGNFYQNREASTNGTANELPFGVEFLLREYRRMAVTS